MPTGRRWKTVKAQAALDRLCCRIGSPQVPADRCRQTSKRGCIIGVLLLWRQIPRFASQDKKSFYHRDFNPLLVDKSHSSSPSASSPSSSIIIIYIEGRNNPFHQVLLINSSENGARGTEHLI
ncbi:hypothetical protein TNCV_1906831 [Trichonephila clavipes]|nr:hypothetical protein TNCV_1906831 [Trichonephila clavipes]